MVLSDRQNPQHRNCFYIIDDILGVVTLYEKGVGKTRIMYRANLSFDGTRDYLKIMLGAELLQEGKEGERTIYKATHKGLEFRESFGRTKQLLKPVQESDNQAVVMPPESLLTKNRR